MPKGYYKDVVKLLRQHGCYRLRQKGSHEIWQNAKSKAFTVSTNLLSRHTANHIMKEAGINHKF